METPYKIEQMAEELCEYCECTEFGLTVINNGPLNLCHSGWCDKAYKNYLESFEDQENGN